MNADHGFTVNSKIKVISAGDALWRNTKTSDKTINSKRQTLSLSFNSEQDWLEKEKKPKKYTRKKYKVLKS